MSNAAVTVRIEDIKPYSVLHVTARDTQTILDVLDDAIAETRNSERDFRLRQLTELRERITQSSSTLRLGVGDHDRLKHALSADERGGAIARRLLDAEPECARCGQSGYTQIRVDGGNSWILCTDCKAALQSSYGPCVLQEIDPALTAVTEISFTWPDQTDSQPLEQTSLSDYSDSRLFSNSDDDSDADERCDERVPTNCTKSNDTSAEEGSQ